MNATTIGFVVLAVIVLLVIARVVYRVILGQSMTETLIHADNKAAAVALGGFMLGVINVIIPVLTGPSHSFWVDVRSTATYGIAGILAMAVSGLIFETAMGTSLREQVREGNLAAGIICGSIHIAASQLVAGALTGDGGSVLPTLVFWAAGVASLILISFVFRLLTPYNDYALIRDGNVAASLGCGGLIIAMGMMIGYAVSGSFVGYAESFRSFGLILLIVFVLYPVRQIVVQMLFLGGGFAFRNGRLDQEITEDRNVGAGLLEAVGYLATALIVTRLF
ncbi:MAG: DUF350 domain-containing protein [Blastocatellia bacterium]|nr:DUF350 domain-containing protein [Blastocatellia bacterium]